MKKFDTAQEVFDHFHETLLDMRAEEAVIKTAAGIALGLLIQNSQNKAEAAQAVQKHIRTALTGVKIAGGDPESDVKLRALIEKKIDGFCDGFSQYQSKQ